MYDRLSRPREPEGGLAAAIAWTGLPFFAAFFVSLAYRGLTGGEKAFAVLSNLSYVFAGLQREAEARRVPEESVGALLGSMSGPSVYFVFIGVSSLAFHAERDMDSKQHVFDILFGLLLVASTAYAALGTALAVAVRPLRPLRAAYSALYCCALGLMITFYDAVYANQLLFYLAAGAAAAAGGVVCRFLLSDRSLPSLGVALFEAVVVLALVGCAIVTQCELVEGLGCPTEREFDASHSLWHFCISAGLALLHERLADAASIVLRGTPACACKLSTFETVGMLTLLAFAMAAMSMKGMGVPVEALEVATGCFSAALGAFGAAHLVFGER